MASSLHRAISPVGRILPAGLRKDFLDDLPLDVGQASVRRLILFDSGWLCGGTRNHGSQR